MTKRRPFIEKDEGGHPERFSYMALDHKHKRVGSIDLKTLTARRVLFNNKNNLPICYDKTSAALPNTKKSVLDFGKIPGRKAPEAAHMNDPHYTPEPPSSFTRPRGKIKMNTQTPRDDLMYRTEAMYI